MANRLLKLTISTTTCQGLHNAMRVNILTPAFIFCLFYISSQAQNNDSLTTCNDGLNCNCTTSFQVPNCINVTVGKGHFDSKAKTIDNTIGGYAIGTIPSFSYGQDNKTVSFCFPTSPQVLHCTIRRYGPGCYEVNEHVLKLHNSDFKAELGDYYIDQEANAYICTEAIQADKTIPRCNYIILENDLYAELDNDSLYINATASILKRASYTIDSERKANVCYPLSIHFLNCNYFFYETHSSSLEEITHMMIVYKPHYYQEVYGPDEYYSLNAKGDLRMCVETSPLIEIRISLVYSVLEYLSLIFSCATLFYQLKTRQSNLYEKCLTCYIVTMIGHYIYKCIRIPGESCHEFFVSSYLIELSSHTWLTLTTFDIWLSFSRLKTKPNHRNFRRTKTFISYSIFGWGGPVLLYILVLITNHLEEIFARQRTTYLPSCWFKQNWASFTFYYGPMLFLTGTNVVLFVLTVWSVQRQTKGAKAARRNGKKQMIIVCIKLFFIMGVGMIIEGIMLSIQDPLYFHHHYISRAFESTQGIAIFIILMSKRDSIRTIRNHLADIRIKWNKCTVNCKILHRKTENGLMYLVEENHMNIKFKQIAWHSRAYILHDYIDGDIFPRRNEIMLAQISNQTQV